MAIDLNGSTWENPAGFEGKRERPMDGPPPPPEAPTCPAQSPTGWTCDRAPHADAVHVADTGDGMPTRWMQEMVEITTFGQDEPTFLPGAESEEPLRPAASNVTDKLTEVGVLAGRGLASEHPSAWAVALSEIVKVINRA